MYLLILHHLVPIRASFDEVEKLSLFASFALLFKALALRKPFKYQ
jgi:hypothetical protein